MILYEEGAAIGLLREIGSPDAPMDALVIADLLGISMVYCGGSRASLIGNTIRVPVKGDPLSIQSEVAHELGHWALREFDCADSESGADLVGAMLMLPRDVMLADMRATAWNLFDLQAKHVNCTAEMLALRIASLSGAVYSVWSGPKMRRRRMSPWLSQAYLEASRFERALATQAMDSEPPVRAGSELLWGFRLPGEAGSTAITLCEAGQLAARY